MKASFQKGLTTTHTIHVDRGRTVMFGDDPDSPTAFVYATPSLVRDIEVTCRELILAHADAGEDSVGSRVDITHKAPTLENQDVTIAAAVTKLDGRAVTFDVTASDGLDEICRCTHDRFIIDVAKTFERLAAKAKKLTEGSSA